MNHTRQQIIEVADKLFYERGFEHTSFADIADAVQISRGNFYYHFKSKDEILNAVIVLRLAKTRAMLQQWESQGPNAEERIRSFIHMMLVNRTAIKLYGCPVGTLCTELTKLSHPSGGMANQLFTLFHTWLRKQFTLLGRKGDAEELAMQLLVSSQGIATLASAFHDERFIKREVKRLDDWLRSFTKDADSIGHPSAPY